MVIAPEHGQEDVVVDGFHRIDGNRGSGHAKDYQGALVLSNGPSASRAE